MEALFRRNDTHPYSSQGPGVESSTFQYANSTYLGSNESQTGAKTNEAGSGFVPYWETPSYIYINMFIYGLGICMWLGTIGNILSLLTLQRKSLRSRSTSFYLSSLAVADTLNLWVMNQAEWFIMVNGKPLIIFPCWLEKIQVAVYPMWSAWIITAVTVERYIAVAYPLKAAIWNTPRRALTIVVALPLLLIFINLFIPFAFTMTDLGCFSAPGWEYVYYNVISKWMICLRSLIPGTILFCLNVAIIRRLRTASQSMIKKKGEGDDPKTHVSSSREADVKKITVLVLTVSITHIVLTIPVSGFSLFNDVVPFEEFGSWTLVYVFVATEILSLMNHSINFLLYTLTSTQFRNEFLRMVTCERYNAHLRKGSVRTQMTKTTSFSKSSISQKTT